MIRFEESDRRILVGDSLVAQNQFVWRQLRPIATLVRIPFKRFVIEDDQVAAGLRIIKQLLICSDQFRL